MWTQETPLRIEKWEPKEVITNTGFDSETVHLGLSARLPLEPNFYWVNVAYEFRITRGPNSTRYFIFDSRVLKSYKIKVLDNQHPDEQELFNCIDKIKHEFYQKFSQEFGSRKIPRPLFSEYQDQLQDCIRSWDIGVRNQYLN